MKLKLWAEIVLILIAMFFLTLIFVESLILNWVGIMGFAITCVPIARFGRLNYKR